MSLNITKITGDMLTAIKGIAGNKWNDVKAATDQFLENKKDRFQLLAEMRLRNEISQEELESRLADEKLIVEAELNALAVISKATAQQAANAVIEILLKAVAAVI